MLAVTTFAFDSLSITAAMPAIVDDLGGVSLYGAAFSGFMLANIFSLVVSGSQADRHGPGPVLSVGLACFVAGLVIGGTAVTMPIVVLGRVVQGLGGGAIGSSAYVVIARGFPPDMRARMFAVLSAAWIVPALVAPGAAGALAEHASWRLVFLGLLPFPLVAGALALPAMGGLLAVDGGEGTPPIRPRVVAALRLSVGTAVVVAGTQVEALVPAAGLVVAGIAVGAPPLGTLLPPGTLRALPVLPALVASRAALTWAFFGADAFVPLAITDVRGRGTLLAGLALTTSSLAWSATAWVQARISPRLTTRAMTRLGVGFVGLGLLISPLVLLQEMPIAIVFVGWSIAGAGMGFAYNATSVAAMDESPAGREGATGSSVQVADALGIALCTGIAGAIVGFGERTGWATSSALVPVFAITFAGAVGSFVAASRLPVDQPPRRADVVA